MKCVHPRSLRLYRHLCGIALYYESKTGVRWYQAKCTACGHTFKTRRGP
jgi:hypothetical protein